MPFVLGKVEFLCFDFSTRGAGGPGILLVRKRINVRPVFVVLPSLVYTKQGKTDQVAVP